MTGHHPDDEDPDVRLNLRPILWILKQLAIVVGVWLVGLWLFSRGC